MHRLTWWMDGWIRVLRPFNSISVISRWWKGEHERLCAMKHHLDSGRISPPAGFEPATPWSEVTQTFPGSLEFFLFTYVVTTLFKSTSSFMKHLRTKLYEPHHEKTCLWGLANRYDSNQSAQLQRLARVLKFWIQQVEVLHYLNSKQ